MSFSFSFCTKIAIYTASLSLHCSKPFNKLFICAGVSHFGDFTIHSRLLVFAFLVMMEFFSEIGYFGVTHFVCTDCLILAPGGLFPFGTSMFGLILILWVFPFAATPVWQRDGEKREKYVRKIGIVSCHVLPWKLWKCTIELSINLTTLPGEHFEGKTWQTRGREWKVNGAAEQIMLTKFHEKGERRNLEQKGTNQFRFEKQFWFRWLSVFYFYFFVMEVKGDGKVCGWRQGYLSHIPWLKVIDKSEKKFPFSLHEYQFTHSTVDLALRLRTEFWHNLITHPWSQPFFRSLKKKFKQNLNAVAIERIFLKPEIYLVCSLFLFLPKTKRTKH